jgi:hypothetical protein
MRIASWLSLGCLVVAGCDRPPVSKPDTTATAVQESAGALASRREAQDCFDAARTAFLRRDSEECITRLAEAAAFFRAQARAAKPDAKSAMASAAEELETFLANVANGHDRTAKDLDRVYAQAHAAESGLHLSRARVAMASADTVRAGEELLMSVDHLERATRDAHRPATRAVRTAIAAARSLATRLIRGMPAAPGEMISITGEMETAMRRIVASIEVPRLVAP